MVVFLSSFLALMLVFPQQLEGPIETRVDQWQPVLPGKWAVSTRKFEMAHEQNTASASPQTAVLACPYSSLLILRSHAAIKLGEPGCQFRTSRVSENEYHIVARCRTLSGKDHYETTTLTVSKEGKAFSSATTWIEPSGSTTLRTEGVWSAGCEKE